MSDALQSLVKQYKPMLLEYLAGNDEALRQATHLTAQSGQPQPDLAEVADLCKKALAASVTSADELAQVSDIFDFFAESVAALSARPSEVALQTDQEKFEVIYQEALDAIIIIAGVSGKILRINPAVERVLGYAPPDLIGQHFSLLLPTLAEAGLDLLSSIQVHDAVFVAQEFLRADGSSCPIDLTLATIPWDNGKAILLTLRDVSERVAVKTMTNRRNRELLAIQYAGAALASETDLEHLLQMITQEITNLLGAQICLVSELNEAQDALTSMTCFYQEQEQPYPLLEGEIGGYSDLLWVLRYRRSHSLRLGQPNLEPNMQRYMAENGIRRLLLLPMEFQDHLIGILQVAEGRRERRFTLQEISLAQLIANQASVAIYNFRLHARLERQIEQLQQLHSLDRAISTSLHLKDVYRAIAIHAPNLLSYDGMSIALREQNKIEIVYRTSATKDSSGMKEYLPLNTSAVGWVVKHGKPLLRRDLLSTELQFAEDAETIRSGLRTCLIVPLWVKDMVIGTWAVGSCEVDAYSDYDVQIAQSIANELAVAIEHAKLYQLARQEIFERKRAEESLREERNFAATILYTARALIVVLDPKGYIIRFNRACEQVTKYTFDDVKDRPFWEILLLPEEMTRVRGSINQLGPETLYTTNENYWRTKDGDLRLISWSNSAILGPDNEVEYIIAVGIDITERRQMEEDLKSSRELFGQVVSSISDHIYVTKVYDDGRNQNLYISPNIQEMTGYSSDQLMSAWDFWPSVIIHPDDQDTANAQASRLSVGEKSEIEYRLVRADKEVIWVRDSGRVELVDGGKIIYGVVSNITERKQYEQEMEVVASLATSLRAALTRDEMLSIILDSVIDLLPIEGAALDIYDPETGGMTVELARGAWLNVIGTQTPAHTGISSYAIETKSLYVNNDVTNDKNLVFPETIGDLQAVACVPLIAQTQIIGVLWIGRRNEMTSDTVQLLTAISSMAASALHRAILFEQLQNSNAELTRLTTTQEAIVRDRTADLETAITEVSEAKDKIDAILHSVADGLIVTDLENKVILANTAAEQILGFTLGEMLDKEIGIGIKDDGLRKIVRGTLNKYINGYEIDIDLSPEKNRPPKIMRAHTSLVDDREGRPLGTVTVLQDVTKIREIDRLKTEFLATAAHEFRTPLTSVQGFSEILLTRELDAGRQRRYLQMINQQSSHLAEIVDDLLDVARLEARRGLELDLKPMDIGELINEVALPFVETEANHQIQIDVAPDLEPVLGDSFRLTQVLKNLIGNAVKYSPEGGTVIVSTEMDARFVTIHISDQGIGMTPEQQEHLFEKFYRADASNTSISGTGLGLAICKLIVELHDGKIWIESEQGQGSTVSFHLPCWSP